MNQNPYQVLLIGAPNETWHEHMVSSISCTVRVSSSNPDRRSCLPCHLPPFISDVQYAFVSMDLNRIFMPEQIEVGRGIERWRC